jgi:MFS transporter, ACS family, glucarate transporter
LRIESACRYQKHGQSLSWRVMFKNRTVWALMFMYFTFQWANYFFVAWMPVYLQKGRHFTEEEVKPILSSLFIAPMLGLLIAGFFSDWLVKKKGLRFGRRFIGMTGFAVCALLIFSAAIIARNDLAVTALIVANGFYGFTVMTCYSVCTDIGKNNAGTVTGAMNFCGQMGAFFLAIIFGKIADVTHSFEYPLFVVAAVLVVGFLLWLLIDPLQQLKVS